MNNVVSIISICFILFPCVPVRSGFIGRYNNAGNFKKCKINVTCTFKNNSHFILIWAISTIYYFCLIYLVKNRYYGRHHEPYNSGYSYHGRKVSPWESDSTGRQDEDEFWDEHEQDMKSKYRNRVQGNFCKIKMIF